MRMNFKNFGMRITIDWLRQFVKLEKLTNTNDIN
jgi:hypothetical protein